MTESQSSPQENNNNKRYSINKKDVLLGVLSVFIPPIPVIMRKGFFSRDCLLNLLLFILFFFPAIIHALYVIYETSELRTKDETTITANTTEDRVPLTSNYDNDMNKTRGNPSFATDLEQGSSTLPAYEEVVKAPIPAVSDNKVQFNQNP
ncbi:hypothetical protein NCAS_0J00940 [Naumovozyma castellii]|uniref:Uncharacterized protein n=1 Tax=Naumovozyma castellii TaxID=27288 RepID=G0VKN6_NAUCA|nr:hypothetical protein NCAS_0J00940 [Naumovozyma castellii CBS 4309]CCC72073.1 hypothetical protein NCAS_0J00940 [Naumovozyma castellii CBS 4309]